MASITLYMYIYIFGQYRIPAISASWFGYWASNGDTVRPTRQWSQNIIQSIKIQWVFPNNSHVWFISNDVNCRAWKQTPIWPFSVQSTLAAPFYSPTAWKCWCGKTLRSTERSVWAWQQPVGTAVGTPLKVNRARPHTSSNSSQCVHKHMWRCPFFCVFISVSLWRSATKVFFYQLLWRFVTNIMLSMQKKLPCLLVLVYRPVLHGSIWQPGLWLEIRPLAATKEPKATVAYNLLSIKTNNSGNSLPPTGLDCGELGTKVFPRLLSAPLTIVFTHHKI